MAEVIDITVEDPSDDFVRLRDYVDSKNCRELESFSKANLANGWSDNMATDAKQKHRLNKKQARRVYEILKLAATDRNNEEAYRSYRLEVKQRLNAPFAKMSRSAEKSFSDNATAIATKEMRLETLKNLYKETEDEYLETIEKLATC
jgi:histone acetyltransferase 1